MSDNGSNEELRLICLLLWSKGQKVNGEVDKD